MPVYKKLVRDLIPQIIEKSGKQFKTKTLNEHEYETALKEKLQEEVTEYVDAETDHDRLEELADILELIHALAYSHGASFEQIESIRKDKVEKRGAYHDRIYLIEVQDDE
ncbi:Predicted house-cleaning noncanonical NTP pyrophosphatase, all-alpha NTP-PPase (MazG) superfamily [Oceanobacillus limi]|uniref:Predicted house-cleaning noncanonical NTP pyrophosphatase, all-alpha NTP-PPase (MazG) superfamily n=1 Tax=Oceanobacillus limi TaxID=930131 RepID=A0A1H9Y052_9BACI|nr:nucleoside triphosphate pyrophosphohydrolase [Oceanobacillus limi]SES61993.1 Predicted house-cleaning noncanonical NTP pyrophosphatase, all-alpha NTP-PPase (MazG) superfamily [Oceanobacillus limi]